MPFSALWSGSILLAILSRLIKVKVYTVILRNNLIRVYTICRFQQSGQELHFLPFSAVWSRSTSTLSFSGTVWSGSTLFVILCSLKYLIRVYIICHSQSDQGLHCLPFSAVWWVSTLFAILSSLIRVYTICHSQSYQGLHYLPFSLVWSRNTLFVIFSKQFYQGLHCLQFSADWLASTLFVILNNLISVYTICHSQQSDQGLHRLPFSSIIRVYTIWNSQTDHGLHYLPFSVHHSQQSDRGLQYFPFSAVWSGSTLFAILSKQYYQGIHCLPFSAVWSGSTVFAIFSCMCRDCTICDSF